MSGNSTAYRDANNNYIKYTYYKDAGEIYPSTILYTGNGSTDGPLEVGFLRTSRSDVRSSAQTGFHGHVELSHQRDRHESVG